MSRQRRSATPIVDTLNALVESLAPPTRGGVLTLTPEEALHLQDALDGYCGDNPPSIVRFLQRKLHGITGEDMPPVQKPIGQLR